MSFSILQWVIKAICTVLDTPDTSQMQAGLRGIDPPCKWQVALPSFVNLSHLHS